MVGNYLQIINKYKLYFGKYVEYLHEKGKTSYNLNQFIAPPRQDYNVPHSDEEKAFVKECGSFRSGKETVFSFIESKFQIFDHTNSKIYIQSKVLWNTMYSLCCLLYNINKFSEIYITELPHHSFWRNEDFEFPSNESELELFRSEKINEILDKVSSQKVQQNTYDFEKSINDNIESLESQPDPPNETNTSSQERGKTRSSRQVSPELVESPKKVTLSTI